MVVVVVMKVVMDGEVVGSGDSVRFGRESNFR